jgi:hypothetical protein
MLITELPTIYQLPKVLEDEIYNFAYGYTEYNVEDYCIDDPNFLKYFFEFNKIFPNMLQWDKIYNRLNQYCDYGDQEEIINNPASQNLITILDELEKRTISFHNPEVLITIGKSGDCPYEVLMDEYIGTRVRYVYNRLTCDDNNRGFS